LRASISGAADILTLRDAIRSGRYFTADEWNWYVQQDRGGRVQPEPEEFGFTGAGRHSRVPWRTYNAQRVAAIQREGGRE
jgi:hypothetical protein